MTDSKKLKERIKESGYKLGYIADKLGLTRNGLSLKINNVHEFKQSEITNLCIILGLSSADMQEIFFA